MCLSCGCGEPDEDHGDEANITTESLDKAARAGDVESTARVVQNIQEGFEPGARGKTAEADAKS